MGLGSSLACNILIVTAEANQFWLAKRCHDTLRCFTKSILADDVAEPFSSILDYANLTMFHLVRPEDFTLAIFAISSQPCVYIDVSVQQQQAATNKIYFITTVGRNYNIIFTATSI